MISKRKLKEIKNYFKKREDVAFAFLFGSYIKNKESTKSDIDIGIYFFPENRHPIEFEKEIFYKGEKEIWKDLEKILEKEIDLVVLNRAPATISFTIIKGFPIIIKDCGLFIDFMEVVSSEAIDFREMFINEFFEREKIWLKK